mmetsp:Transcript_78036/g.171086  ORF Transcript_78036/g.171086 Transcript_78036/m.171086 type:complete len:215 (+) Transcript_78036:645-1289(+)
MNRMRVLSLCCAPPCQRKSTRAAWQQPFRATPHVPSSRPLPPPLAPWSPETQMAVALRTGLAPIRWRMSTLELRRLAVITTTPHPSLPNSWDAGCRLKTRRSNNNSNSDSSLPIATFVMVAVMAPAMDPEAFAIARRSRKSSALPAPPPAQPPQPQPPSQPQPQPQPPPKSRRIWLRRSEPSLRPSSPALTEGIAQCWQHLLKMTSATSLRKSS